MYASPSGMQDPQVQKAPQACMTCRKQKRKCSKTLPACTLCERMNRHCDYSDSSPPPTSEDFNALRMKLMELESRLNGGPAIINPPTPFATPSSSNLSGSEVPGAQVSTFSAPQENPWQAVPNRFPAIAFLDNESYKYGGYV